MRTPVEYCNSNPLITLKIAMIVIWVFFVFRGGLTSEIICRMLLFVRACVGSAHERNMGVCANGKTEKDKSR